MITLNKKYAPLIKEDSRYTIITGGRGSAKSFSINTYLCLLMLEDNRGILFLRKTLTSAHVSIIPEFIEKLDLLGIREMFNITKTEIKHKSNGSVIYFRGIQSGSGDNTANLKSLNNISVVVIDEAEELTDEKVFDRIDLSVRQVGITNKIIIALNPSTKTHWVYKRFFEDSAINEGFNGTTNDTTYIHTDYRDNAENLSESFLQQVKAIEVNNPEKYNHVILGGWLNKAEGVIFTNWKIGNFEDNGKTIFGNDYGFAIDPTTLIEVSIIKSKKRIYLKECYYKAGLTTSEIYDLNKSYAKDRLIIGDSAEPRLIEELKQKGLNIQGAVKGQGSVTAGIALMQDYELIIEPNSTNLIKELNNYVWNDKKSSTPIDAFNHCFVGDTLITTENGLIPIKDIKIGDRVLTSEGYKKVLKKFNNGAKQVNKYLMQLDTFSVSLCSTKEHKIKSDTWKEISTLQSGMMVYQHKPSMDLISDYIQKKSTSQEVVEECTLSYGNIQTVNALKDTIFTTKTKIHGITHCQTWNALYHQNTYQNTVKKDSEIIQNLQKNFNQKELKKQKSGIGQNKVLNGIKNTQKDLISEVKNTELKSASTVQKIIQQKHSVKSFVQTNANHQIDESKEQIMLPLNVNHAQRNMLKTNIQKAELVAVNVEEQYEAEVYDLMVEDCHEYFANGILVHNCLDSARYAVSHELMNQTNIIIF